MPYFKEEIQFNFRSVLVLTLLVLGSLLFIACDFYQRPNTLANYGENELQIFEAGLISTNEHHEGLSYISPGKDMIIFSRSSSDFSQSGLYQSNYENGGWTIPKKIELGDGTYQAGLTLSPNRKKGYFTNKLRVDGRDSTDIWNIWEVQIADNLEFLPQTAKPVDSGLNSNAQDCCMTMNSQGDVYFSSDRDGSWDIYSASFENGAFVNIKKLKYPINDEKTGEWPSYIDEENSYLMFSSIRKNGIGGDDIYYATKSKGSWQEPILFDKPINSNTYEDSAQLVDNGQYLFFSSWRADSTAKKISNIYILPNPILIENQKSKSLKED